MSFYSLLKLKEFKKRRDGVYGTDRGFTLYYAAVFGGILILIGASMLNVALKEFLLSASIRESEYAFFAADSGTECALYWDLWLVDAFATTSGNNTNTPFNTTKWSYPIACNAAPVIQGWPYFSPALPALIATPTSATSTFHYNMGPTGGTRYCVLVQVGKFVEADGTVNTIIDARGYNYPCDTIDTRKVERALITQYPRI